MKTRIELVKELVGQEVMTVDPLNKLGKSLAAHGPYKLLKLTKSGRALLQMKGRVISVAPRDIVVEGYHDGSNRKTCHLCKI